MSKFYYNPLEDILELLPPDGNFVKVAGDTMTGTLVSPLIQFTNPFDNATLNVGWSNTTNRYELDTSLYSLALIFGGTNSVVLTDTLTTNTLSTVIQSNGGGVYLYENTLGNSLSLDSGGNFNLTSSTTSPGSITAGSDLSISYGQSGGGFVLTSQAYGTQVFSSDASGKTTVASAGSEKIYLTNSPGNNFKTVVNNGFEITDDGGSTQAFISAYYGQSISFGSNTFTNGAGTASSNIAIGTGIFNNPPDGSGNIGIGTGIYSQNSLTNSATNNIGIGSDVMPELVGGESNIGIGVAALRFCTEGDNNLAIGALALRTLTTGSGNLAIGVTAGYSTDTGTNNTFIGNNAGAYNVAGAGNTYIGESAGAQVNGNGNIAIGPGSLAGAAGSIASLNISIGSNLFPSISTGNSNIAIAIGGGASGVITTGSKNIIFGYDSDVPSGTADNQMSFGNAMYGINYSTGTGSTVSTQARTGFAIKAPTATVDIQGSTTGQASLRIRSGTAPTSPQNGDIWFDGTDIKIRIGGVTKTFVLV